MNTLAGRLGALLVLALLLPATLHAAPSGQAEPLQITIHHLDSENFPRVSVYATIADSRGIPIDGLTPSAFSLSEDERPVSDVVVSPSERPDRPVSLVLALDISNSLGESGVEAVRGAALAMLDSLPPQARDRIALITFGNPNERSIAVERDFTADVTKLRDIVSELTIGPTDAYTAFWGAAYEALDLLEADPQAAAQRRRAVVVLTDGVDNSAIGRPFLPANTQRTQDETIAYAQQLGMPIYPISFGGETDAAALEQLAVATQGISYISTTPRDLELAFADVLATLRHEYRIDFTSGLPADDAEHTLSIRVAHQARTATGRTTFTAFSHPVQVRLNLEDGQTVTGNVLIQPEIEAYAALAYGRLGVNGAPLQEFGAGAIRYTWNTAQLAPGPYTLELFVRDSADNTGQDQVTVNVTRPLSVEITSPTPNARLAGQVEVAFTIASNVAEVNVVTLLADGREVASLVTPQAGRATLAWDASAAGVGGHQLEVRAHDTVGNQASASVVVNVVPELTLSITAPAPNADVSGEVAIAYTAETNVAPVRSDILLVDGAIYAVSPAGERVFWHTDLAPLGPHTLQLRAIDTAGNAASDFVTLNVTRSLGLAITAPEEGARVAGGVQVAFALMGRPTDVADVRFFVDELELESATDGFVLQAGRSVLTWDASAVGLGLHRLEVRLVDTLGDAHADTTFVNVVKPLVVRITSPAPNAQVDGQVAVAYQVETNAAPLRSVALRVDGALHTEGQGAEGALTWNASEASLGLHALEIVAADQAGHAESALVEVRVARSLSIAINAPEQAARVAGQVLVRFTLAGCPADVARAEFWVEGRRIATLADLRAGANALTWDTSETGAGLRQLEIRLTDTTGGYHIATVVVNVVEPLVARITSPAPNAALSGVVSVAYAVEARATPLYDVALRVDGVEVAAAEELTPQGALLWDTTPAALGAHALEIIASDEAGNQASQSFTVNVARPLAVSIGAPTSGATVAGQVLVRFTLEGLPADVARAVFFVDDRRVAVLAGLRAGENTLTWDTSGVALGPRQLEIRLTDTLENEIASSVTVSVVEPLTVEIVGQRGEHYIAYRAQANAAPARSISLLVEGEAVQTVEDPPLEGELFWDSRAAPLGQHSLEVCVTDADGREVSASTTVEVRRPLGIRLTAPPTGAEVAGSASVRFTVSGQVGDVSRVTLLVDERSVTSTSQVQTGRNTITWEADPAGVGVHLLEVRLYDTMGTLAATDSALVTVIPPLEVGIVAPVPNAKVAGQVAVRYRAQANAAALARVTLLVDGEEVGTNEGPDAEGGLAWDASAGTLGAHQLQIVAEDTVGNQQSAAVSVEVVPPVVLEMLAPVQDELVAGVVTVRFAMATNAAPLARVTLLVDGEETASATEGRQIAWDTTSLAPGVHEIEVRAVDAAGYEDSQTLNVTVHQPITVRMLSPDEGERVAGQVDVRFTVEANAAALARVTLLVDGQETAALEAPQSMDTIIWDATGADLGTHRLTLRAADSAGNATEASLSVTLTEPLTIDLTDPVSGTRVTGRVSVRYRAVVTGAQLETVTLKADSQEVETLTSPAAQGSIPWDTDPLSLGRHQIEVVAQDTAGHTQTAAAAVVVTRPLSVEIVSPAPGEQVSGRVEVRYQASAAPQEIARATLLVNYLEVEAVPGPLAETVFTWETGDVGAGAFTLAVAVRDVTGQEQTSEPATVQVIFQGNSLPIFIAVLVVLFIAAIVVPITLNRRRRLLATAASAAEPPAALPAAVATSAEAVGKAYLVSEGGPTAGARWLLAQDEIIVGRSRTRADVVVTGRTASRQHARITCAGDDFIYVDLNPENPSLINGQEPSGPHTLEEGNIIEVGDTRLRFTRQS